MPVGRTKLDETKKKEIVALLSVGCSKTLAARYVGCAVSTIRRTALRDPEFAEQLRRSEHGHEFQQLKNIYLAAKKYWRAAAWALERLYPDRYAPRAPGTVTTEQITQVLAQFAVIIGEEVPVAKYRKNILQRLEFLAASLQKAHRMSRAGSSQT